MDAPDPTPPYGDAGAGPCICAGMEPVKAVASGSERRKDHSTLNVEGPDDV